MKKIFTDVLIVGSGVAGLSTALNLKEDKKITLITKKDLSDSNSYLAQGGISIRHGRSDRDDYIKDTLEAGHYENSLDAVKVLVDESEDALDFLIKNGVDFTKKDGKLAFTKEGGHSRNRIAYCDDVTGKRIMEALIERVKEKSNINILSYCKMEDLLIDNNTCKGVYAKKDGEKILIYAENTVLACGGLGAIFKNTTNFSHIKGDGIALAIKHNIALKDISYIQIHPTSLFERKEGRRFLISESVRGEGAVLLNQKHNRFTDELKPRDIVTKAILMEMKKDDAEYEFLDMKTIKLDIEERFPNIVKYLENINIDPKKDLVPIVPAAHYTMGGIKVDLDSKTSAKNLYAVGEVACTGVHGKNRLASNSLLESVVFGKRAALSINKDKDVLENKNLEMTYDDLLSDTKAKILIKKTIDEDNYAKNKQYLHR